jgi:acetylglutamate kinase
VLTADKAEEALVSGGLTAGMKPKIQALVDAVRGGVERGHILSGLAPGSLLLELFTRAGSGTLVVEHEAAVPKPSAVRPVEAAELEEGA